MLGNIRAVLFDFDGTLIQPSIDFDLMRLVVLDIVRRYGIDTGPLVRMHVLELVERVGDALQGQDHDQRRAFVAATDQALMDIELEAAERVNAYDGVPNMLAELGARGYGVGIVTRNCRLAVERILARIPMHHDVLLTRDDVAQVKPDPAHLLAALEVLGVPGPRSAMCGDHTMDIVAGQRIGARTVGVLRPDVERAYFSENPPDLILSRVTDLLAYLP